ncbi:MAG: hypothetical protein QFX32_08930, partial [Methanolinea sp.]|nr:hypothetical protein [Methanolinea sp.]
MFYVGRDAGTTHDHVEAHTMRLSSILAAGILAGLLVLSALPAQAQAAAAGKNYPTPAQGENRMDRVLDMLEEKRYDVSAIRSALASGDVETARSLLREFMQENPGALAPAEPRENRMDRVLDMLEEK